MFDYEYRSLVDRQDDDHIRLLSLAPSRDWTDAIHVRLVEARLSDDLVYEALSYCWGDISKRLLIFCDGKPFLVSENLETALRHLRLEESERILWIDAICINQADYEERKHQVGMMRSIYSRAKRVLVWLGEAGEDSELAFAACERIAKARVELLTDEFGDLMSNDFLWRSDKSQIIQRKMEELKSRKLSAEAQADGAKHQAQQGTTHALEKDDNDIDLQVDSPNLVGADSSKQQHVDVFGMDDDANSNEEETGDVSDATKEEVIAILKLISRPWFTRCWVLQEFVLGREVQLLCGTSSIDSDVFYVGFTLIVLLGNRGLEGRPEQILRGGLVLMHLLRMQVQHPEQDTVPFDILWLLQSARSFGSTDPRDKVYSLLGLIPKEMSSLSRIKPDYTVSVEECYKQTALAIISHTNNLDVLLTDRQTKCEFQLPSWVPDWSQLDRPAPIVLLQTVEKATDEASKQPMFCASLEVNWTPDVDRATNSLILSGYVLDRLVLLEDVLTVPEMDFVDLNPNLSSVQELASFSKNLFSGLGNYFDILVRWEKLALSKNYPTHPTNDDPETVYAMTMCAGDLPGGPEHGLIRFRRWRETLRAPKKLQHLKSLGIKGGFYKTLAGLSGMVSGRRNLSDRVFATATEKTLYRRLARTEKGYLALVPRQSAVGDRVALFKGGKTPFLVRQARFGMGWELVGSMYIHGLMYGEQWKTELCQDMFIV
ncbi:uncharacterized protein PV09_00070 [Verruconis gallopava]|uniref:Heterokaryon incompatibility domain-containing protein n=1 Tax=Verruconis gallopava TaxID=253628 RepID=A0A0D1Z849_9PEZI|nr:uncharacterized protein PV09_00070 [Verruconis gallopava]KIW09132.1 hypothetical protein PV09_00070 [Verruconis gallopava]